MSAVKLAAANAARRREQSRQQPLQQDAVAGHRHQHQQQRQLQQQQQQQYPQQHQQQHYGQAPAVDNPRLGFKDASRRAGSPHAPTLGPAHGHFGLDLKLSDFGIDSRDPPPLLGGEQQKKGAIVTLYGVGQDEGAVVERGRPGRVVVKQLDLDGRYTS
jgi:hypothetical protein